MKWVAWGKFNEAGGPRWQVLLKRKSFLSAIAEVSANLASGFYKVNPTSIVVLQEGETPRAEKTSIPFDYCWTDEDLYDMLRTPLIDLTS